jgi:hypothetical protein
MTHRPRYRLKPANRALITLLTILLGSLPARPGLAENNEPEQETWYQVEVIVYRNNTPGNENLEEWPQDIKLDYPEPLVFLTDPNVPTEPSLEQAGMHEALPIPIEETLETDGTSITRGAPADEFTALDNSNGLLETESQEPEPVMEQPFILLDQEQRLQNAAAAQIERSPYFRVLFHQAWRQAIPGRAEPSHILVTGGERYGEHYELEGSLSISKSRYLHLATNLWLNEIIVRPDENALHTGPGVNPYERNMVFNDQAIDKEALEFINLPPVPVKTVEHVETEVPPPDADSATTMQEAGATGEMQQPLSDTDSMLPLMQLLEEEAEFIFDEQLVPDYVSTRTVKMAEHRRMRSKELHYLDHPLFGLVVIITPYDIVLEKDTAP